MRSTGIVRRIDDMRRIVIPIEVTRTMGFEGNQPLEVYTDGDKIVLCKYQPGCIFCGQAENVIIRAKKPICLDCIKELQKQTVPDNTISKR